jgi:hypothetical protein
MDTKGTAKWICMVCAALYRRVPAPEGFLVAQVHPGVLDAWNIPQETNGPRLTRVTSQIMAFLLAWSMENEWLDREAFREGLIQHTDMKPDPKAVPVMFKRPRWWERTWGVGFRSSIYADSDEDREFHAIFREALGNREWTRTAFIGDLATDFWREFRQWREPLPDDDPQLAQGIEGTIVIPWATLSSKDKGGNFPAVDGVAFAQPQVEAVKEAVKAHVLSRCLDPNVEPGLLPKLWTAIGLTRN